MKIKQASNKCECVLVAQNLPSDAVSKILEVLSQVHAVFRDLDQVYDVKLDDIRDFFKPHLDLGQISRCYKATEYVFKGIAFIFLKVDKSHFSEHIIKKPIDFDPLLWASKKYIIIRSLYSSAIEFNSGKNPIISAPEGYKYEIVTLKDTGSELEGHYQKAGDLKMISNNQEGICAQTDSYEEDINVWLYQMANLCLRAGRIFRI